MLASGYQLEEVDTAPSSGDALLAEADHLFRLQRGLQVVTCGEFHRKPHHRHAPDARNFFVVIFLKRSPDPSPRDYDIEHLLAATGAQAYNAYHHHYFLYRCSLARSTMLGQLSELLGKHNLRLHLPETSSPATAFGRVNSTRGARETAIQAAAGTSWDIYTGQPCSFFVFPKPLWLTRRLPSAHSRLFDQLTAVCEAFLPFQERPMNPGAERV